jgi:phage/plasmid-associated DNA primase
MQQAIDDCSRVLEYCDVFDNCFTKRRDLCYKAFMRRGQALKFNKDFDLAIQDFQEAKKLEEKEDGMVEKWIQLTEADREHEQKIKQIMENSASLKGKEYLDYLIAFLKGNKDA